ncbi:hypothetical protein CIK05_11400 [Bdellovibrio sp. qaytius]|nr:hypothetical protein CIK05_11400 [Bdellovibrio sp. qaytius]
MNLPEMTADINSPVINYLLNSVKVANVSESTDFVKVVFNVESLVVKEMTERHLLNHLHDQYSKSYNKPAMFEFIVESRQQSMLFDFPQEIAQQNEGLEIQTENVPAPISFLKFKSKYELSRQFTFESLIPTLENAFSIQALQTMVLDKSITMPFALIKGPSGSGKSHLLHAIGWFALSQAPHLKIKVVSGDEFINDFQTALFTKTMGAFRDKYRLKTDFLLIDDIQAIQKAKGTQLELFNLMNDYSLAGKKIFFTSDSDLMTIDSIEERLKSRFQSGLQLNIESPCYDSKLKYFSAKLFENALDVPQDFIGQMSQHFGSCYRSVEGIVNRLIMLNKVTGFLDMNAIDKMFPVQSKEVLRTLSVDAIIEETAFKHKIKVSDIKGKLRTKLVFAGRKEAIMRIRTELNLSVTEIARIFQKDHTSILNALK